MKRKKILNQHQSIKLISKKDISNKNIFLYKFFFKNSININVFKKLRYFDRFRFYFHYKAAVQSASKFNQLTYINKFNVFYLRFFILLKQYENFYLNFFFINQYSHTCLTNNFFLENLTWCKRKFLLISSYDDEFKTLIEIFYKNYKYIFFSKKLETKLSKFFWFKNNVNAFGFNDYKLLLNNFNNNLYNSLLKILDKQLFFYFSTNFFYLTSLVVYITFNIKKIYINFFYINYFYFFKKTYQLTLYKK